MIYRLSKKTVLIFEIAYNGPQTVVFLMFNYFSAVSAVNPKLNIVTIIFSYFKRVDKIHKILSLFLLIKEKPLHNANCFIVVVFYVYKRIITMNNEKRQNQSQKQNHFSFDFSLNIKGEGKNISGKKMMFWVFGVVASIVCVFVLLLLVRGIPFS